MDTDGLVLKYTLYWSNFITKYHNYCEQPNVAKLHFELYVYTYISPPVQGLTGNTVFVDPSYSSIAYTLVLPGCFTLIIKGDIWTPNS